jgi:hypothetical protein
LVVHEGAFQIGKALRLELLAAHFQSTYFGSPVVSKNSAKYCAHRCIRWKNKHEPIRVKCQMCMYLGLLAFSLVFSGTKNIRGGKGGKRQLRL